MEPFPREDLHLLALCPSLNGSRAAPTSAARAPHRWQSGSERSRKDLKLELLSTILLYLPRMNFTPGYKRFHRNHLEPMDFLEIPLAPDVLISHTNG